MNADVNERTGTRCRVRLYVQDAGREPEIEISLDLVIGFDRTTARWFAEGDDSGFSRTVTAEGRIAAILGFLSDKFSVPLHGSIVSEPPMPTVQS